MLDPANPVVHCACVIHGDAYEWLYVENLYASVQRHLSYPVKMHVWTEAARPVPPHMIKHELRDWPGISGPKRAWWYKMQMFNHRHYQGWLLYFDLDVVIVKNLDWILSLNPNYFWSILDFRYLWRAGWDGMNSSMMYWNTMEHRKVWKNFAQEDINTVTRRFAGDQDYLNSVIDPARRRYFDKSLVQSWRWQIYEGGMDMKNRQTRSPGSGAILDPAASVVVFHGKPKPHEIVDSVIFDNWRH